MNGGQQLYRFGKVPVAGSENRFANVYLQVQGMEITFYFLPWRSKVDRNGRPTSEQVKIIPEIASFSLAKN